MYAKVFSQIYDGSLCTNGPWEALVTFQQMLVLADQDGVVDMTANAIARRTTVPIEIIEKGIAALVLPDPDSRTPIEEGRRLLPLASDRSWGWRVVNYKQYRDMKREQDRKDYHREYWHKRKEKLNKSTETQQTQPNQPIAYAEADEEKEKCGVSGFSEFWAAWPKTERKGGKAECARIWKTQRLEASTEAIVTHVRAMAVTDGWAKQKGAFVPAPAVYLRGKRWDGAEVGSDSTDDIFSGAK